MTLDKFRQAWKVNAAQVRVSFDDDQLSRKVQQAQSAFQSMIFWRDVREVGLALLMIPIWFAMGTALALPWTWYLTVPVFLWIAGFMAADRRLHPQTPSKPGEPLSFYVKKSLNQIEHQIWLLRNVFWWALLPPSISIMAFFLQVGWDSVQSWWGAVIIAGFGGSFIFYVYRWIYRLNQSAVREQLEPRRDKLREFMSRIESGSTTEGLDEIFDLIPVWPAPVGDMNAQSNWAAWAENWNRIIPSWYEVTIIIVPTLIGAYCGWRFAIPDFGPVHFGPVHFGPVFFQSVVAAVIPFEIAFFSLWYRSHKRHQGQPQPSDGTPRPKTPAVFTIGMILVISILAVAAFVAFVRDQQSRRASGQRVDQSVKEEQ